MNSDTVYLITDLLLCDLVAHILNIDSFASNCISPTLPRSKALIVREMKSLFKSNFMPVWFLRMLFIGEIHLAKERKTQWSVLLGQVNWSYYIFYSLSIVPALIDPWPWKLGAGYFCCSLLLWTFPRQSYLFRQGPWKGFLISLLVIIFVFVNYFIFPVLFIFVEFIFLF